MFKVIKMRIFLLVLSLLVTACSPSLPSIKPYKMPIQQGNLVSSKMMMQLKPGMTKTQVRFVMGTPLINDSFHKDQWDYFYQMEKDGAIIEKRRVILMFEKDLLAKVKGDVIPANANKNEDRQDIAPIKSSEPNQNPAQKEKSMLDRLKFWEDNDKPIDKVIPAKKDVPVEDKKIVTPKKDIPEPVKVPESDIIKPVTEVAPADIKKEPAVLKPEAAKAENTKPLPAETEPNYFDLMLEKIGF
ncbi:outer membrane protein assembly factor BamE domain-containing protein [Candidatus Methylopumilus planktonicus]|jgi:outer membrane protein assembly factor BamE|uniref:outer membrane protein assembly factor BamE domain-containing protein n=1 Tax=Candidatus Methylopumilus planktonicus TaxID=1581557 RepID=UPI003BEEB258